MSSKEDLSEIFGEDESEGETHEEHGEYDENEYEEEEVEEGADDEEYTESKPNYDFSKERLDAAKAKLKKGYITHLLVPLASNIDYSIHK